MTSGVEKIPPMFCWRSMPTSRRFPPARGKEHRFVEFPVGGQDPAFVLLRRFGLEIPERLAGFEVARLKSAIQDADQDDVARDHGRGKHVGLVLFLQKLLPVAASAT